MQRKFPPTHEDQKAKKLMEKLADRLAVLEKKTASRGFEPSELPKCR